MKPLILPFHGKTPKIHETAFVAPGAVVIGDVTLGPESSVWYGCVLRGDTNAITVGARTNVQDGTIVHVDERAMGAPPVELGDDVLIGHRCILHGCRIEDGGFVGMGATVLDGAVIESGAFLAAGAFLSAKKRLPAGELWAGMPARKLRDLREGEDKMALDGSQHYVHEAAMHREALGAHES